MRAVDGIHFCEPIGHRQEDGDYRESWQPQAMSELALARSKEVAAKVVEALGGYGLFGVELFIRGDEVWFSEVSPPHDTGMVTLISQDLSEFALHVRAILGLPVGTITQYGPSASAVVLREGHSQDIRYQGIGEALALVPGPVASLWQAGDRRSSSPRGGARPWAGLPGSRGAGQDGGSPGRGTVLGNPLYHAKQTFICVIRRKGQVTALSH